MPHQAYLPERMGTAIIAPTGAFAAGSFHLSRPLPLKKTRDNALYVCLTQEDDHLAWSTPVCIFG